jgi:uncharacterized protein involved in outer membrane biogenesis
VEKSLIVAALKNTLNTRIENLESQILSVQNSANEETKSSAGDKYETGRAMAQNEIFRLKEQLEQFLNMKNELKNMDLDSTFETAQLGSLVETDKGSYLMSVGLGQIKTDFGNIMCISKEAPIFKNLLHLKKGEKLVFNTHTFRIIMIA